MEQAKPCVGILLGAPRRLVISRQGRTGTPTGAGRVGSGTDGQQPGNQEVSAVSAVAGPWAGPLSDLGEAGGNTKR
jgi:hypothetical protein